MWIWSVCVFRLVGVGVCVFRLMGVGVCGCGVCVGVGVRRL